MRRRFGAFLDLAVVLVHRAQSIPSIPFPEVAVGTLLFELQVLLHRSLLVIEHDLLVDELFELGSLKAE